MSTGDIIITCDLCYETYYYVNGHDCVVAKRKRVRELTYFSDPVLDKRIARIEWKLDRLWEMLHADEG